MVLDIVGDMKTVEAALNVEKFTTGLLPKELTIRFGNLRPRT